MEITKSIVATKGCLAEPPPAGLLPGPAQGGPRTNGNGRTGPQQGGGRFTACSLPERPHPGRPGLEPARDFGFIPFYPKRIRES